MQSDTSPIPVITIEEHNEALVALAWARETGAIQDGPVRLLHLDQHADLNIPTLSRSIAGVPCRVAEIKDLVETEISIATFLWAGAYLGLINEVFWLSPDSPIPGARPRQTQSSKRMLIATTDPDRRELLTMVRRPETLFFGNDDRMPLDLHFVGTNFDIPEAETPWVLGIDLDYFSCNSTPENGFRISVTEGTYLAVRDDAYHPLRLSLYHRVRAVRDGDDFCLEFDMLPSRAADPLIRDTAAIVAQVSALADMLRRQSQPPALVVIARSRISGFTPQHQWQFIEKQVLQMLRDIFPCAPHEGASLW